MTTDAKPQTRVHKDGATAKVLAHLADNGPTTIDDMRRFAQSMAADGGSTSDGAGYQVVHRLMRSGFVANKLWLTPEGLKALKATGWEPDLRVA